VKELGQKFARVPFREAHLLTYWIVAGSKLLKAETVGSIYFIEDLFETLTLLQALANFRITYNYLNFTKAHAEYILQYSSSQSFCQIFDFPIVLWD
jgi:hypothetical protein